MAAGSDRDIGRLYDELGPIIFRRCYKILKDYEAARDATQDVFLKLVHELPRLPREAIVPWIYRVSTRDCLNILRAKSRSDARESSLSWVTADRDSSHNLPEKDLAAWVLNRFDLQTSAVAVGVLVDGMEYDEVATHLGLSRRTVARRLAKFLEGARTLLRQADR